MDDRDKKLFANLIIATLCAIGYGYVWRELFGDSEFSMIMMASIGLVLLVALTQKLKD